MHVDGECLCGFFAFEAEVNPDVVFVCHCTDCQIQSGTSFRAIVPATPGTFKIERGELRAFVKTAESGKLRSLAFCPECGTSIYGGPKPGEDGMLNLRVGALRQRDALRPRARLSTRSAQPWLDDFHKLTKIETQGSEPSPKQD